MLQVSAQFLPSLQIRLWKSFFLNRTYGSLVVTTQQERQISYAAHEDWQLVIVFCSSALCVFIHQRHCKIFSFLFFLSFVLSPQRHMVSFSLNSSTEFPWKSVHQPNLLILLPEHHIWSTPTDSTSLDMNPHSSHLCCVNLFVRNIGLSGRMMTAVNEPLLV